MYWSEVIVCFTKPNYFGVLPHPDIQDDYASSPDPLPHERVGSEDETTCTHAVLTFAPLKLAASSECISLRERGWKSSGEAWLRTNTEDGGKVMYIVE